MIGRIKYYYSRFGIHGLTSAIMAKFTNANAAITVNRQDIRFPFHLRTRTSDILIFDQIFKNREYDFLVEKCPRTIVDAGANTGLASIFFSNKFPEARIIAIEPEASNYEMLKMNVAPYRNIITMNAALWGKNEEINVVDPGLGKWGFMTIDNDNKEKVVGDMCHKVQGITIDKLMEDLGIERIDILKIDIEGAEKEVFEVSSSWIDRVDAIIVELHERMKSGCNRSFYCGSNGFDDKWEQGEHVFLSRKKCLIKRPA